MAMATLTLYKNKYVYPDYGSITKGKSMSCTPVGLDLKSGTLHVKGTTTDFMSYNYLALERSGELVYAWIENVTFRTEDSFEISYRVDPFRTYRGNIIFGNQYISRAPGSTNKQDGLLGAIDDVPTVESKQFVHFPNTRVLVVQTRPRGTARMGYSSTPVQPSPYTFWCARYDLDNWQNSTPIVTLLGTLGESAESSVVTMYSIPYFSGYLELPEESLVFDIGGESESIPGWRLISHKTGINEMMVDTINIPTDHINMNSFLRVDHTAQIVVPEAGVLNVPDELLTKGNLQVRRDMDLFSGASNYMLVSGDDLYTNSIRGSSASTIPVLSDIADTYISQNQNSLTTSLIGDVATVGMGGVASMTGLGAMAGVPMAFGGIASIMGQHAKKEDLKATNTANPPAMLGTALTGTLNGTFWIVTKHTKVSNSGTVHSTFGYPHEYVKKLSVPSSGFIQTENCNISSDGSVPRWAIEEINQLFDRGLRFH